MDKKFLWDFSRRWVLEGLSVLWWCLTRCFISHYRWYGLSAARGGIIQGYKLNTLRPRQNGHRFPDNIFKCIFLNENVWISIKISLKFVPKGPINNIPALVQIMAWRRSGDKPLSEPMMVSLLTHICVTRPQWVNSLAPRRSGYDFKKSTFTQVQFWPSGIILACVCVHVSVRLCINHKLIHVITAHLLKLEPLNLDQKCKTLCSRSLLFWGWLTLTLKFKFNLKVKIYPILSLSTW